MSNENAARNRFVLATPRPVRATESEGRGRRKDRRSMPAASGASHTAAQAMGSTQKTDSPRLHGWERRVFYTGCETQGQRIRAGGGLRWASGFADRADAVLVIGSTMSVYPAVDFPLSVARRGAPMVILNQGPTDHDRMAAVVVEGRAGETVPALVRSLLAR